MRMHQIASLHRVIIVWNPNPWERTPSKQGAKRQKKTKVGRKRKIRGETERQTQYSQTQPATTNNTTKQQEQEGGNNAAFVWIKLQQTHGPTFLHMMFLLSPQLLFFWHSSHTPIHSLVFFTLSHHIIFHSTFVFVLFVFLNWYYRKFTFLYSSPPILPCVNLGSLCNGSGRPYHWDFEFWVWRNRYR